MPAPPDHAAVATSIRTPDQRLRVFVSSTLHELAEERRAVRSAIEALHLTPVMFESGARPHPPRELYRAYLRASDVFVGVYGERYGWVAADMEVSGLEDEYDLATDKPRLLYVRRSDSREPRLSGLLERVIAEGTASFAFFDDAAELRERVADDLAALLSEAFAVRHPSGEVVADPVPTCGVPVPVDELVGRERELRQVSSLLSRERLTTLTGPGGVGKTRIALEVLRRLEEPVVDGPWFVDLSGVDDPALLPSTVAQVIGARVGSKDDTVGALARVIGSREALLVLDNCEHLVEAAASLGARLLASCPRLRILATSREPLRVRGEVIYALGPLPVTVRGPDGALRDGDAMRLFEIRAAQVNPDFALDETNREAVHRVVSELDGLPLAIELSAARMRVLSPAQLAERMSERFTLLAGGPRDAPYRHRALVRTIDWSYDLLSGAEQLLFRQLSVFRGGFELDAVQGVTGLDALRLIDLLDGLLAKSLILPEPAGAHGRWRLLSSLRAYGDQRLAEHQRSELRQLHLEWYVQLTDRLEPELRGPGARTAFARLDRETDNARAALAHAVATGQADRALRVVGTLSWFWYRYGHVPEALVWIPRALQTGQPTATRERGRAILGLGIIEYLGGDLAPAALHCEEAGRIAEVSGDDSTLARARLYGAYFRAGLGDLAEARRLAVAGRDLAGAAALADVEAEAYTAVGQLARFDGDREAAEALFLRGAELAHRIGHHWQEGSALWCAGKLALDRGDLPAAFDRLWQALELNYAEGDRTSTLVGLQTLAGALALLGNARDGARVLGAVQALGERIGFSPERMDPLDARASIERVRQHLSPADFEAHFGEGRGLSVHEAIGHVASARRASREGAVVH